jgi:hypothetical protein
MSNIRGGAKISAEDNANKISDMVMSIHELRNLGVYRRGRWQSFRKPSGGLSSAPT